LELVQALGGTPQPWWTQKAHGRYEHIPKEAIHRPYQIRRATYQAVDWKGHHLWRQIRRGIQVRLNGRCKWI